MSPSLARSFSFLNVRCPSLSWIVAGLFCFQLIVAMGWYTCKLIGYYIEANASVFWGASAIDSKYFLVYLIKYCFSVTDMVFSLEWDFFLDFVSVFKEDWYWNASLVFPVDCYFEFSMSMYASSSESVTKWADKSWQNVFRVLAVVHKEVYTGVVYRRKIPLPPIGMVRYQ